MTRDPQNPVRFSVVIPLYNKEREVAAAIRSAMSQTYPPSEIVVVDDGSTDRSAEIVRGIGSPLIRPVAQENAGVSAARNTGIAEARAEYIALLDADDAWDPRFLEEIARLIVRYPGCGLYCTAFRYVKAGAVFAPDLSAEEGIIPDYFKTALRYPVATASSSVIPKAVFEKTGGFPEGMRLGEDQYMWTKIALRYPVCYSPQPLVNYHLSASNRSASIYEPEVTEYDFRDFYREGAAEGDPLNEYIAKVSLNKAIVISSKGGTDEGRDAERFYRYTRLNRRAWRKLFIINRIPASWRPRILACYNRLAWLLARKGT